MDDIDQQTSAAEHDLASELLLLVDAAVTELDFATLIGGFSDIGPDRFHAVHMVDEIIAYDEFDLVKLGEEDGSGAFATIAASFFMGIAAIAASKVGHVLNAHDRIATSARDKHIAAFKRQFADDSAQAIRETAERLAVHPGGDPESKARHLRRVIGLSPAQAENVTVMRRVLAAYLNAPKVIEPATVINGKRVKARKVPSITPAKALEIGRGHLSAPQRNLLAKAMQPDLTAKDADKLLDTDARKLVENRANFAAGHLAHELAEVAKGAAWQAAQRAGRLRSDQRRYWQTAGDERVRHAHAQVPGMNPSGVALDQPFATPLGPRMNAPLEPGCRCKAVLRPSA